MISYEEKVEREKPNKENPFKILNVEGNEVTNQYNNIIVANLEKINELDDKGRLVLKYVLKNLNQYNAITNLEVVEICKKEFKNYPDFNTHLEVDEFSIKVANTLQVRIRRGIKNLLNHKVIAKTNKKDWYWVNKSIVWR